MNFKSYYLVERDDLTKLSKARAVVKQFELALHKNFDIYLQNFLSNTETNLEKLKFVTIPFEKPLEKLRLLFPKVDANQRMAASYSPPSEKNNLTATMRIYSKDYRNYVDTIKDYTDEGDKVAMKGVIKNFKSFVSKLLKDSSIVHELIHVYDDSKGILDKTVPKNKEVGNLLKTINSMEDSPLRRDLVSKLHSTHINQSGEYNAEFLQAVNDIIKDLLDKKISIQDLKDFKVLEKEFWKNFKASKESVTADNIKRIKKRLYDLFTKLD